MAEGQRCRPTIFSTTTSTNVEISSQTFLTLVLTFLQRWCTFFFFFFFQYQHVHVHDTNRVINKAKTKLQILKRCAMRYPALTSDITLMVRCCTNIYLLPTKTCQALFKNRGKTRDLEELVGSEQCYYIMFTKQM